MDIHSNAVSSGLPEENFPGDNMEGGDGVSLEWLAVFVEECLNGGFTCQQPPPIPPTTTTTMDPPIITEQSKNPKTPSKMRAKRRKLGPQANNSIPTNSFHVTNTNFEDSTLLPQTYWLADSELILPQKENEAPKLAREEEEEEEEEEEVEISSVEVVVEISSVEVVEISNKEQPRRCTHCLSQKTPQWRAGPLGTKTLCNACGVRFKSGRLLPEYRPAKSPTFESYKHSNSHKKVMEMRKDIPSPHTN